MYSSDSAITFRTNTACLNRNGRETPCFGGLVHVDINRVHGVVDVPVPCKFVEVHFFPVESAVL